MSQVHDRIGNLYTIKSRADATLIRGRALSGTAPRSAHDFDRYVDAIRLIDPDGYASWDYPQDRPRSMQALHDLTVLFPEDVDNNGRLWPVFSTRWTWDDRVEHRLADFADRTRAGLGSLIPLNSTQRPVTMDTRNTWARAAIMNALLVASDPDFRWMAERFGRVMLGGMVHGPCPRLARHLYAATLCRIFPDTQFWLLGQANYATVNGLGMLGLLDRVSVDGTWWLLDSASERFATVENGLITMHKVGNGERPDDDQYARQSFFTIIEMSASNLRSLFAAYQGLWSWPPHRHQAKALKQHGRDPPATGSRRDVWRGDPEADTPGGSPGGG